MVKMDWQSALLIAEEMVDLVMRVNGVDIVDLQSAIAELLDDHDGREWDGVQWIAVSE